MPIGVIFAPYLEFAINGFRQNYSIGANFSILAPITDVNIKVNETIHSTYYDFGIGWKMIVPFCRCSTFYLGGSVFGSYAHSKLDASNALQNITAPIFLRSRASDKKSRLSEKVKGFVGFSFCYRCLTFVVEGDVEYWGYIPQVHNPHIRAVQLNPPLDGPAKIHRHNAYNYSVGAKLFVSLY